MLEIIALIFMTKNIGNLAIQKGIKPGPWKLYTVLAWFVAEFIGAFIGYLILEEIVPAVIIGLVAAVISFFILKNVLAKKPDQTMDDEISKIGQPQL